MPTYDYVCDACGHALEIYQPITEAPKRKCPKCGKSKLARRIGAGAGFLFKGAGFHKTDYRSESYKAGEKAAASAASPSAKSEGSTPTEAGQAPAKSETASTPKVEPKSDGPSAPAKPVDSRPAPDSKSKKSRKD